MILKQLFDAAATLLALASDHPRFASLAASDGPRATRTRRSEILGRGLSSTREVMFLVDRVEHVTDFVRLKQQGAGHHAGSDT